MVQRPVTGLQPGVQPSDFAFAHVERASGAAAEHAIGDRRFGGNEVLNADVRCGEFGDEAVGGGGHHHQIARRLVLLHQRQRRGRDSRHDHVMQKTLAQRLPVLRRTPGQGADIKVGEFVQADGAGPVARVHVGVLGTKVRRIQQALGDQEVAPQHIAVATEQRVVQIKKHDVAPALATACAALPPEGVRFALAHACRKCQALGRVKVWMP